MRHSAVTSKLLPTDELVPCTINVFAMTSLTSPLKFNPGLRDDALVEGMFYLTHFRHQIRIVNQCLRRSASRENGGREAASTLTVPKSVPTSCRCERCATMAIRYPSGTNYEPLLD